MPNGEIFEKALSEDRIVLTSDLDFGEIAAALKDTSSASSLQVPLSWWRNPGTG